MALLTAPCVAVGDLHIGDQIFRRYEIRDEDGILTNSALTVTLTKPDATTANLVVVNESVGIYLVTFGPFDQDGVHRFRAVAAGPVFKVDVGTLHVDP